MAVLPRVSPCEAAQDVARGFVAGTPFSLELARRGTVPLAAAIERVTQAVAETHGDPPVGAKMQAIVILARVP